MKTLQSIQKTFRVFQILAKIAFIFSIVGASLCALGALCTMVWYGGGQVFSLMGQPILPNVPASALPALTGTLLADMVFLITDAVLLGFAGSYFRGEQADGTPFTQKGAERVKRLGIRCIYMPIVATVIAAVISTAMGSERGGDVSNLPSLVTGLVLILASLIFRYGAELEQKQPREIPDGED